MDVASLCRDLADLATASDDGDGFLARLGPGLIALGVPLWRLGVGMPALDTDARSYSTAWQSDGGITEFRVPHGPGHEDAFLASPIRALLDQDITFGRWRLDADQPDPGFPVLREMRHEGATDYILHLAAFSPGTALHGVALSFATRDRAGFTEAHLALIRAVVPVCGLAAAKLAVSYTFRRTLGTYLGTATSEEVLGGRITRGEGRTIWAAILLVDLRGFTTLADRSEPTAVVGWLDDHLDALGQPVLAAGGEILKFLGDGFLAVFPIASPDARPCRDCERALASARAAETANKALNRQRAARDLPQLEADLVLHFGEVVYGNVGTRQRLDFTVIGRAVNEASRIERCCEPLGRSILCSDTFAARCPHPLVPVGEMPLRGLARPHRLWGLAEANLGAGSTAVPVSADPSTNRR